MAKRVWCGALLALVALTAFPAAGAGAQEAPPTTAGAGAAIQGVMQSGSTPIEGVRVLVTGVDDPSFEADATSDQEGHWIIPVPGRGVYRVAIDPSTIPEEFELANPDRIELPNFRVFADRPQNVVFAFKSDEGGIAVPSRWERLLNLFVSGVRLGLIIGVCSVGLSLVFGTTGLVNFAHGELVTFGALVAFYFNTSSSGPQWSLVIATLLAMVGGALLGSALELGLWRPMVRRRSGVMARMLVSIGLALALRYTYEFIFGAGPRAFREFSAQGPLDFGPLTMPARDYWIMAISVCVLVGVGMILQLSRLGTAVRAVADERDLAAASGIDVKRVILYVWAGGTALAALGGVMLAVSQSVQYNLGFRLLLTMFAAVVLGGLGSAYGAMVGGLAVGIAQEVSTYWISPDYKFAVALVILILVLLVRPQGILGVRERVG
ncbi:MAG TPA: branched-chain amino acid ABC transporter permease [Acidimicrobiia bacterium]|nr:branched-chain amino acid ABC transporter permease [Acidimicrobiia bacterium]